MSGMGDILMIQGAMQADSNPQAAQKTMMMGAMLSSMEHDDEQRQRAAAQRRREEQERRDDEEREQRRDAAERQQREAIERHNAYVKHINGGIAAVQDSDFQAALAQFTYALSFKPGDVQARFNIACCTESLGDMARAFALFAELDSHAHELQDFMQHRKNCSTLATNKGYTCLKDAQKFFKKGDAHNATLAVNSASSFVVATVEGNALRSAIEDFTKFMHWQEIRDSIGNNFIAANEKLEQKEFRVAQLMLRAAQKSYNEYAKFLTEDEAKIRQEIPQLLAIADREVEKLNNIELQNKIQRRLPSLQKFVASYDMLAAQGMLKELCGLAHAITNPGDVQGYILPQVFDTSVAQLDAFIKAFADRKQRKPAVAAQAVVDALMEHNKVSLQDMEFLQTTVTTVLRRQWLNLDRRNLELLQGLLETEIKKQLQQNSGCLVKVCCYPPFYVDDKNALGFGLGQLVQDNLPQDYVAPIQLDLLTAQQQAPGVFFGTQTVVAALPVAQAVGAPEHSNTPPYAPKSDAPPRTPSP